MQRPGLDALALALDNNIVAYPGAKLKFKLASTSTLLPVYDTPTLTNSLGSTITADAAGAFAPFWFDPTKNYDAELLTSGDVLIKALPNIYKRSLSRIVAQANFTLYVNHSTGNNNNTVLSSDKALATITRAYEKRRDEYDLNGFQAVIQVADGTFDEVIIVSGLCTGYRDLNSVIIRGNTTTPANCFNSHAGIYPCMSIYEQAMVRIEGMKFANPSATDHCFKVYRQAYAEVGKIEFGNCGRGCLQGADGWIVPATRAGIVGSVRFTGDSQHGGVAEVNGGIDLATAQITFDAGVEFSGHFTSSFINVGEGAYFGCHGTTWTGTFTGRKYYASDFGVIVPVDTIESIPGSIEGIWASPILTEPQGRLTLTDATPVTTSDVTAATTIHYEPDVGDYGMFAFDDTSNYEMVTIGAAGLSLALTSNSGHTNYHQSGKNFDLFLIRKSDGTPALASGPAWTNDTTRSAAISRVNGVLANTASMVARFGSSSGDTVTVAAGAAVYVGTFRASADGQTEDSVAKRFLWNCFNRRLRAMSAFESTDSWTYSTATVRQMNANAANQVAFVRGLDEDVVTSRMHALASCAVAQSIAVGIGLDSTTAFAALCLPQYWTCTTQYNVADAHWSGLPGLGYHYLAALEYGNASTTVTWYGDLGVPSLIRNGITAEVWA